MAKTIKIYGTNTFLYGKMLENARKRGLSEHSNQVRIICGATSLAEANRLCEAEGLSPKTFRRNYASISYNATEIELARNGGIFIGLSLLMSDKNYYPISELKE
jgi:hypothetical protein